MNTGLTLSLIHIYSREYSDSHYLYRIEPEKEPGRSRLRLEPQFLEDGGAAGNFQFEIDGEALDMRRLDEKVLVLMDREEDNIDAVSYTHLDVYKRQSYVWPMI